LGNIYSTVVPLNFQDGVEPNTYCGDERRLSQWLAFENDDGESMNPTGTR